MLLIDKKLVRNGSIVYNIKGLSDSRMENGPWYIFGFAANEKLMNHYIECFDALYVGMRHPYHFVMGPEQSSRLIGEYDYEWTNAKI